MPFYYYGAKHKLASKYPAPQYDTIVEPFAGSAAYSIRWATDSTRVILYDLDPAVIQLWHEIQGMKRSDLDAITRHVENDERTNMLILAGHAGSAAFKAIANGKTSTITPRIKNRWGMARERIWRSLPRIRNWEIRQGTYADIPNMTATWFIDPPYSVHDLAYGNISSASGNGYRHGASDINYTHLGDWCQSRLGQIIVCEQAPADWLPFTTFHQQINAQNTMRTEVIWTNTPTINTETLTLF